MDRKLLFKSNIMGNSVMRRNRAAKANSDRNIKRKELFVRGRDISVSPGDAATPSASTSDKKKSKKSEEIAQKEEAYRARFVVYMQQKRQRLAQEKASKKPPFISAVGGQSTHQVAQKAFEFTAPKPVSDKSKVPKLTNSKTSVKIEKPKSEIKNTRSCRSAKEKSSEASSKKQDFSRPANLKITKPAAAKEKKNNQLHVGENIQKETPLMKDKVFVFNNVGPVLTSTARKHSSANDGNIVADLEDILSPIDGIAPLEATILDDNAVEKEENPPDPPPKESQIKVVEVAKQESPEKKTPPKSDDIDTKHFYLSPFVTTSRGKVSAKKERSNRDSVYKLELNRSTEEPVEVRRRREAVRYFRKVLDDETNRLSEVCATWTTYKEEKKDSLEEQSIDLINVATGQTKLLISGKLKQFEKLVDDCEQFANKFKISENLLRVQNDISPEDLEGYWNIVKLQIENVDRRFESLAAWRDNDWKDPDEKPKQKRTLLLAKSMKPKKLKQKMKPKEEVRSLIMKARREYLKNKINNIQGDDHDIVFVSRRSQNNVMARFHITPSKSPARRIIKTPYRTSIAFKENRTPNITTPAQRRLSVLLKASGSGNRSKRRLSETPRASSNRKSILKSTAKNTLKKSVLFSEKVLFKSPEQQQLQSTSGRSRSISENEVTPRVMELRTRKVLLRDDISDFL